MVAAVECLSSHSIICVQQSYNHICIFHKVFNNIYVFNQQMKTINKTKNDSSLVTLLCLLVHACATILDECFKVAYNKHYDTKL